MTLWLHPFAARQCGLLMILMATMHCGKGSTNQEDYQLYALWYPNVTQAPPPSRNCPVLTPGDGTVEVNVRGGVGQAGAALRLGEGQHATVTAPIVNGANVVCWVLLAKWQSSGTLVEFLYNGESAEVVIDTEEKKMKVYRNTWWSNGHTERYEPDADQPWQTIAMCFDDDRNDILVWKGYANSKTFDRFTYFSPGFFIPNTVRLGFSPTGGRSNPVMEVMCLMLFTFADTVSDRDMDKMVAQCRHPFNATVLGCVHGVNTSFVELTVHTSDEPTTESSTTMEAIPPETTPTTSTEIATTSAISPPTTETVRTSAIPPSETSDTPTTTEFGGIVGVSLSPQPACRCSLPSYSAGASNSTIEEAAKYSSHLLVNRSSLSSTRRKKESATDDRMSAVTAGYVGITLFCLICCLVVCLDLTSLLQTTTPLS